MKTDFFLGKKEKYDDPWLFGKEDEQSLFCCAVFFDEGMTKVGGLNLKVIGFSLMKSTIAFSFVGSFLPSKLQIIGRELDFVTHVGNRPKKFFFFFGL